MTRYRLTTEVFSLPRSEGHLVYAPLIRTSVVVNDAALALLGDIAAERPVRRDARSRETLDLLEELEVITRAEAQSHGAAGGPETREGGDAQRDAALAQTPAPTSVTLFPTSACNLRCVYCYASGGDHSRFMRADVADDAVDLVVANAVVQDVPEVRLSFHGGGEPTLAGPVLRRSVERARRACEAQGLRLSTGTATNGVMDDHMREYLATAMTSVMVSIDGPPEVQDRLRPRPGGGPSSAAVERTLAHLSLSDVVLGVRLTCTAEALACAEETVRRLAETYRLRTIHLEPLFVCGRSLRSGVQAPGAERFVRAFRACRQAAADHGVELAYSGAHQGTLCRTFCQASLPSFNVTPEGDVTACYEVTGRHDPRAGVFVYGAHDPATRTFVFDPARVAALRRLTVDQAPRCGRCFAKYHCAGDCPAKRMYAGADEAVVARCDINRRLTLDQLEEVLQCPTQSPAAV